MLYGNAGEVNRLLKVGGRLWKRSWLAPQGHVYEDHTLLSSKGNVPHAGRLPISGLLCREG